MISFAFYLSKVEEITMTRENFTKEMRLHQGVESKIGKREKTNPMNKLIGVWGMKDIAFKTLDTVGKVHFSPVLISFCVERT